MASAQSHSRRFGPTAAGTVIDTRSLNLKKTREHQINSKQTIWIPQRFVDKNKADNYSHKKNLVKNKKKLKIAGEILLTSKILEREHSSPKHGFKFFFLFRSPFGPHGFGSRHYMPTYFLRDIVRT
jgi:hypothetical protein